MKLNIKNLKRDQIIKLYELKIITEEQVNSALGEDAVSSQIMSRNTFKRATPELAKVRRKVKVRKNRTGY